MTTKDIYRAMMLLALAVTAEAKDHSADFSNLAKDNTRAQIQAFQNLREDPGAIVEVRAHLDDPNPIVRKMCVVMLHRAKDAASKEPLRQKALTDTDWLVRERAIIALADYKSPDVLPTLAKISGEDAVVNNRVTALRYLSHIGGDAATSHLKKNLNDSSLVVRLNSARELARRGDKSGYKLAKDSLRDKYWGARAAAAATVGLVGTSEDSKELDRLWRDGKENGEVRSEAFSAVRHIGLKNTKEAERPAMLEKALKSDDAMMRRWAVRELVERPDGEQVLTKVASDRKHAGHSEAAVGLKKLRE